MKRSSEYLIELLRSSEYLIELLPFLMEQSGKCRPYIFLSWALSNMTIGGLEPIELKVGGRLTSPVISILLPANNGTRFIIQRLSWKAIHISLCDCGELNIVFALRWTGLQVRLAGGLGLDLLPCHFDMELTFGSWAFVFRVTNTGAKTGVELLSKRTLEGLLGREA